MENYNVSTPEYRLTKVDTGFKRVKITSAKDASEYIRQFYHEDIEVYESFFILLLDRSNSTIGYAKISQGGISGTVVDSMIVAKYCVDSLASGVILAHNHPSGSTQPSEADKSITKQLREGLKLLNVSVLDHVILTKENYYSFQDNGLL